MARVGQRDERKEVFWRRMLRRQARSGSSIRAWCEARGLREPSFYWWRAELRRREQSRRLRRIKQTKHRSAASFVPVRIATASAPTESNGAEGRIEILLPGDCRVQVIGRVAREALADVLAALTFGASEARPC